MDAQQSSPAEKLRAALDLFELGLSIHRAQLGRTRPDATERAIDAGIA